MTVPRRSTALLLVASATALLAGCQGGFPADTQGTLDRIAALRDRIEELDWKVHDVVIAPVPELPPTQTFRSTLRTGPTVPPSVEREPRDHHRKAGP